MRLLILGIVMINSRYHVPLTPRFDTKFFMTIVNDIERDCCVPDGKEIVDLEWSYPEEILEKFERRGLLVG
jgi:hypothetical protein